MGKSRLEQCQSTKELKYETILRPVCGNSSELLLFEFTGFLGHVLISSARSSWFSVIFDLYGFLGFLSSSMCICGALQSSTVYLCAGGRRWQCLGGRRDGKLPGWARQRGPLGHLPDEIRCPGCPPVDAPARWWEQWPCSGSEGGRGATSFSNLFHGGKRWKNFRSSCEVHVLSQVEWHHHWHGWILIVVPSKKVIQYFLLRELETNEFDRCTFLSKSLTFTQVGHGWYMVQYIYQILSDIYRLFKV